ncbi:MAG: TolC family protein [Planctomycetaceae bacterium]|nr:TolC family protein [Planctomycetaceae bacterium]
MSFSTRSGWCVTLLSCLLSGCISVPAQVARIGNGARSESPSTPGSDTAFTSVNEAAIQNNPSSSIRPSEFSIQAPGTPGRTEVGGTAHSSSEQPEVASLFAASLNDSLDDRATPDNAVRQVAARDEWDVSEEASVSLSNVIESVHNSYPLLEAALFNRNIALGEAISASGQFDLKLKGASENGPTGFYQTYRQSLGVQQPLYGGGEVFAGYRVGRGDFQPWYLERQTNDGGEFKAGVSLPLLQNVAVDQRRADLWNAQYGRQLAEPEIQALLIDFVREASYAYWEWVAAGANYRIAQRVLELAEERTTRIRSQVDAGLIDPPELTDNLRLVADRRAKLADAQRKQRQTAMKLSLYLRDPSGQPIVAGPDSIPGFPEPDETHQVDPDDEVSIALNSRPELRILDWQRKQLEVDYGQAKNLTLPALDAVVQGSQDMGQPTSSKRDKSQFEMEAGIFLDVPVQRRKARGKIAALEGKFSQLRAKRRMVSDKITVEVINARIALEAALIQVEQTEEAVRMAEDLAERERVNQESGSSDLLKVTLREQYAAESASKAVDAKLLYYQAEADLRAAMGIDQIRR